MLRDGRVLARSRDTLIAWLEPFTLASRSDGRGTREVVQRVSTFALALAGIVGGLVLIGAVPPMIGAIASTWLVVSIAARLAARRNLDRYGVAVLDLDARRFVGITQTGLEVCAALDDIVVRVDPASDEEAPYWITAAAGPRDFRLGRVGESGVPHVLRVLRTHHVRVDAAHFDRGS